MWKCLANQHTIHGHIIEGNGIELKPRNKKKILFFFFHKKRLEGKFELVSLTLMLDIILEHSSIESWERQ